jgi:hypothetical protein
MTVLLEGKWSKHLAGTIRRAVAGTAKMKRNIGIMEYWVAQKLGA